MKKWLSICVNVSKIKESITKRELSQLEISLLPQKKKKDEIVDKFDAIAAEMEGGSIGHVCYVNNVPFTILRSISDSEGGQ